jgi:hypothetical protein
MLACALGRGDCRSLDWLVVFKEGVKGFKETYMVWIELEELDGLRITEKWRHG